MTEEVGQFKGTPRFEVRRLLGAGAFGEVYQAYDRERLAPVALKLLKQGEGEALLRFKREFRRMADLDHPNLVRLYELIEAEGRWFFTMELIEGVDVLSYVHDSPAGQPVSLSGSRSWIEKKPAAATETADPQGAPTLRQVFTSESGIRHLRSPPTASEATLDLRPGSPLPAQLGAAPGELSIDFERLRSVLIQLAASLRALHRAGVLHRDIKPSNILVDPTGRVVVLDFGVIGELQEAARGEKRLLGTPAYMSPEQLNGAALDESSDWYAVGIVLFQALTGRRPFRGNAEQLAVLKTVEEAPSPAAIAKDLPADLVTLCNDLLRRDPRHRPPGEEVSSRLGGGDRGAAIGPEGHELFVGRAGELARLDAALTACRDGRASVICIHGSSGMGKSALLRRFTERARALYPGTQLLMGRCHEREAVPYQALDGLVDEVAQLLATFDADARGEILPDDFSALARLFPVLLPFGAQDGAAIDPGMEEQALRRQGERAFRQLLANLSARGPLVLTIDDLQWGDRDSVEPILALLRPPTPPLLLVLSYRSEHEQEIALLEALVRLEEGPPRIEVALGDLVADDAQQLAYQLLRGPGTERALGRHAVEELLGEARGSPLFISQLARHWRAHEGAGPGDTLSLDEMVRAQLSELPAVAREFLEIVASAALPLPFDVAQLAMREPAEAAEALRLLLARRLLRSSGLGGDERLECFHDRLREIATGDLESGFRRQLHRRLAEALEVTGKGTLEALAVHFHLGGDEERAAHYAVEAAGSAAAALAFEGAARLYQMAIDLNHPEQAELYERRGAALSSAGLGRKAAEAYLAAAALVEEPFELRRRAMEQWLISGHVVRGLETARALLSELEISYPPTPNRALASLLWRRARLALRGLKFQPRPEDQIPRRELLRVDTCWSVGVGLTMVDTIRGASFQAQALLEALAVGEPFRVARALGLEIALRATEGEQTWPKVEPLITRVREVARGVHDPRIDGMLDAHVGVGLMLAGRLSECREVLERAERRLEGQGDVTWERDTVQYFLAQALRFLGDLHEMNRRAPLALEDAERRGDRYGAALSNTGMVGTHIALDNAEAAADAMEEGVSQWRHESFQTQDFQYTAAMGEIALYRADYEGAWAFFASAWPRLQRSLLMRVQFVAVEALSIYSRVALGMAAHGPERERPQSVKRVRWCVRKLRQRGSRIALAFAELAEASLAEIGGARREAIDRFEAAAAAFDRAEMALHTWLARWRWAQLEEGPAARAAEARAVAEFSGQGAIDPRRLMNSFAPGGVAGRALRPQP